MQDMIGEVSKQLISKEFIEEPILVAKHKPVDPHLDSKAPLTYVPGGSISTFKEVPQVVPELLGKHILKVDMFSRYQVIKLYAC